MGSDIEENGLQIHYYGAVPEFVAEFEQKLDSKPGLAPDVCTLLVLTGHCSHSTFSKLSATLHFWTHILGPHHRGRVTRGIYLRKRAS